ILPHQASTLRFSACGSTTRFFADARTWFPTPPLSSASSASRGRIATGRGKDGTVPERFGGAQACRSVAREGSLSRGQRAVPRGDLPGRGEQCLVKGL